MLFKKAIESKNYEVIDKVLEINNQIIKLLSILTLLNISLGKHANMSKIFGEIP